MNSPFYGFQKESQPLMLKYPPITRNGGVRTKFEISTILLDVEIVIGVAL